MFSVINDLKIQQKLTATFGAVVLAIALMGGGVLVGVTVLEKDRQDLSRTSQVQMAAEAARLHMARQDAALRAYVMSRIPSSIDQVSEHRSSFNDALDTVKTLDPSTEAAVEQARAGVETWFEAVAVRGVGLTDMADYDGAALLTPVNDILQKLVDEQAAKAQAMNERQHQLANIVRIVMVAGALLALLIAGLSGWWLTKAMATPLRNVTGAMRRLVAGDTNVHIEGVERRDEVGMLASAVAHFKTATQEKLALEHHNAVMQQQAEEQRAAAEEERAENYRQDMRVINAMAEGLDHLARGDLTWRFDIEVRPMTQGLKDNFNIAMERLERAVSVVHNNVGAIQNGVEEIRAASDDLSRRTEQQAATLEETAAALDQITATVTRTADGAREAASVVLTARTEAEHSGTVVTNAVDAMNAIEASSVRIGNIIGVIDEIAFQTNLLALNAGVEAARAGDAGRGFAVVASEVRALAQRSAAAAKEIKTLISASGQQVGSGVNLVGQTGDALKRIVGRVSQIDALVNEIAASAQEQAIGLAQVNTAVNHMDQVTQQNAAMVEESTAASHSLSHEAETLSESVAHFTVSPMAEAVVYRAPVARPVAQPAPRAAPRPVAAPPVAARAPAPRPVAAPTRAAAPSRTDNPVVESAAVRIAARLAAQAPRETVSQAPVAPRAAAPVRAPVPVAPRAPIPAPTPAVDPALAQRMAAVAARSAVPARTSEPAMAAAAAPKKIVERTTAQAAPARPLRPANEANAQTERPRSVQETLAALRTPSRTAAALKSQPIEDGWEEF